MTSSDRKLFSQLRQSERERQRAWKHHNSALSVKKGKWVNIYDTRR